MNDRNAQSIELAGRLEEVEDQALRHGKKIIAKLEERVRAMEGELGEFERAQEEKARSAYPSCLKKSTSRGPTYSWRAEQIK